MDYVSVNTIVTNTCLYACLICCVFFLFLGVLVVLMFWKFVVNVTSIFQKHSYLTVCVKDTVVEVFL